MESHLFQIINIITASGTYQKNHGGADWFSYANRAKGKGNETIGPEKVVKSTRMGIFMTRLLIVIDLQYLTLNMCYWGERS